MFAGMAEQKEWGWSVRVPVVGAYNRDEAISVRYVRNPTALVQVSFKKHEVESITITEKGLLPNFAPNPRREWFSTGGHVRERVMPYYWSLPTPGEVIIFRKHRSHWFRVFQVTDTVRLTDVDACWVIPAKNAEVGDVGLRWFPDSLHKANHNTLLRIPSHLEVSILEKTATATEKMNGGEQQAKSIRAILKEKRGQNA